MRRQLAELLHRALRRLPGSRNTYAQRDALAAALAAAQAELSRSAEEAPYRRHAQLAADSGFGSIAGFLLRIAEDGPLGASGDPLLLPFDEAMSLVVLRDRAWQAEEIGFLRDHADPGVRYALLDIGANIGLFARQAQRAIPQIEWITCVEADPLNFLALTYNLAHLPPSLVSLHNIALAERRGQMTWYRDTENFGNYSLNPDAMRDRPFTTLSVAAVETSAFFTDHAPPDDARVIWKSDTQGYDEAIVTRVPDAIWDRVDMAILELWRIAKPDFNHEVFRRRIAAFPNRTIGAGNRATADEVMEYLGGRDWTFSDLYLWR